MDEDATWYGSRPRPGYIVLEGVPVLRERGTAAPSFRPTSIVATVEHAFTYRLLFGLATASVSGIGIEKVACSRNKFYTCTVIVTNIINAIVSVQLGTAF